MSIGGTWGLAHGLASVDISSLRIGAAEWQFFQDLFSPGPRVVLVVAVAGGEAVLLPGFFVPTIATLVRELPFPRDLVRSDFVELFSSSLELTAQVAVCIGYLP